MEHLKPEPTLLAESVINSMPLCVYRIDQQGKITYANKMLLDQLCVTWNDVIGKTAYDFYPPDLAEKYREDDKRVVMTRQLLHEIEQNCNPTTGKTEWVEVLKTPLIEDGEVIGVQGVFWDISERFLAERENQKNQALLQTLAEYSPEVVLILDEALTITYANRPLPGLAETMLGGSYLPDIIKDENNETAKKLLNTLISGQQCNWQTCYLCAYGKQYFLEMRAVKIQNNESLPQLQLTATDITHRVESERKLRLAATVYTSAREAILITDADGKIIDSNQAFTDMSGYLSSECCGAHFTIYLYGEEEDNATLSQIETGLKQQDCWQGELHVGNKEQSELIVMTTISAVRNLQNDLQNIVILLSDITKQKQHQRQLEHVALYDTLTNLPNRYALNQKLDEAMRNAKRNNERMAIMYLDLDGFKAVNDRHGHTEGDKLLTRLAQKLSSAVHKYDFIARIGGDEFVILAIDINCRAHPDRYYKRLLDTISQPIASDIGVLELSASLGITFYPQTKAITPEQLLHQADVAMYEAKKEGKNRFSVYNCSKGDTTDDISQEYAALKQALDANELELFYQPIVNMRLGKMVAAEALLRWNHPTRGLLSPGDFLHIAANSPLMVDIDQWVIKTAVTQLHCWLKQVADFQLSINVDIKTLEQPDFINYMECLIDKIDIEPNSLTLEIRENSAIADIQLISQAIHASLDIGIRFSLDNFGTGYSTLKFLNKLPATELKIDRSIVGDMLEDEDDMALIQGVQGLAHAFNKSLVAEGVETEAHGFALLNMGCDLGQGFAIAKPMQASKLLTWRQNWAPCPSWIM